MNARVLIAAFAGAIAYFLLGWLVYGILTPDFYATHSLTQYYNGLEKTPPNFLGIFVSGFAYTLLMAIIFGNWANITTIRNGAIAGATLSLLFTLSLDLGMWSTMNLYGRWIVVVDVLMNAVMGTMIGAVVAAVLGYNKTA